MNTFAVCSTVSKLDVTMLELIVINIMCICTN